MTGRELQGPHPAPVRCAATRQSLGRPGRSVLQRRPHSGEQAGLRDRRAAAMGRDRIQVSRRSARDSAEERTDSRINFIKRLVGFAGRDGPHPERRRVDQAREDKKNSATGGVQDRPQAAARSSWPCSSRCSTTTTCRGLPKHGWPAALVLRTAAGRRGDLAERRLASFAIDGVGQAEKWLRYHHCVPSYAAMAGR